MLVHHRAVVKHVEKPADIGGMSNLGNENLYFHWLHFVGENLAENLGVVIRQASSINVISAVLKAFEVSGTHTSHSKLIKLVVATHCGKRNAIVNFGEFPERVRRIFRNQSNALVVHERTHTAAASDTFPGVVGPILHNLFGRNVRRHHAHLACTSGAMASNRTLSSASLTAT